MRSQQVLVLVLHLVLGVALNDLNRALALGHVPGLPLELAKDRKSTLSCRMAPRNGLQVRMGCRRHSFPKATGAASSEVDVIGERRCNFLTAPYLLLIFNFGLLERL